MVDLIVTYVPEKVPKINRKPEKTILRSCMEISFCSKRYFAVYISRAVVSSNFSSHTEPHLFNNILVELSCRQSRLTSI